MSPLNLAKCKKYLRAVAVNEKGLSPTIFSVMSGRNQTWLGGGTAVADSADCAAAGLGSMVGGGVAAVFLALKTGFPPGIKPASRLPLPQPRSDWPLLKGRGDLLGVSMPMRVMVSSKIRSRPHPGNRLICFLHAWRGRRQGQVGFSQAGRVSPQLSRKGIQMSSSDSGSAWR